MENLADQNFEGNVQGSDLGSKGVHHYHAHGETCEDMGSVLKQEHSLPHEVLAKDEENEGEHGIPAENIDKEEGDHDYPGLIRKIR